MNCFILLDTNLLSDQLDISRRRIIIKHIPQDRCSTYSSHQINKQAAIYESFMYRYKVSYKSYMDMTTLEDRVIRCANFAMGTIIMRGFKRPQLIVRIDVEKRK
jgi:hypothetical protein